MLGAKIDKVHFYATVYVVPVAVTAKYTSHLPRSAIFGAFHANLRKVWSKVKNRGRLFVCKILSLKVCSVIAS
jgi:hypothetical protein